MNNSFLLSFNRKFCYREGFSHFCLETVTVFDWFIVYLWPSFRLKMFVLVCICIFWAVKTDLTDTFRYFKMATARRCDKDILSDFRMKNGSNHIVSPSWMLLLLQAGWKSVQERKHRDEIRRFERSGFNLNIHLYILLHYLTRHLSVVLLGLLLQAIFGGVQCKVVESIHRLENSYFFSSVTIFIDFVVVRVLAWSTFRTDCGLQVLVWKTFIYLFLILIVFTHLW